MPNVPASSGLVVNSGISAMTRSSHQPSRVSASAWLRVFAPGETQALYVSHAFDACSSDSAPLLTVMPVRSGQGVQGTTP